jgi:hypothetical protein
MLGPMTELRYDIRLGKSLDPSLLRRVEDGENLVQTILHAHLIIERALAARISEKLAQPAILDENNCPFTRSRCFHRLV